MKLKTLKDLKEEADELSFGGYTVDTLKEEAINWIKADLQYWLMKGFDDDCARDFIIHFFNISEDDLK